MTSAPRSASVRAASGPAHAWVRSSTRTPCSGPWGIRTLSTRPSPKPFGVSGRLPIRATRLLQGSAPIHRSSSCQGSMTAAGRAAANLRARARSRSRGSAVTAEPHASTISESSERHRDTKSRCCSTRGMERLPSEECTLTSRPVWRARCRMTRSAIRPGRRFRDRFAPVVAQTGGRLASTPDSCSASISPSVSPSSPPSTSALCCPSVGAGTQSDLLRPSNCTGVPG